jgi:hypothetical protein
MILCNNNINAPNPCSLGVFNSLKCTGLFEDMFDKILELDFQKVHMTSNERENSDDPHNS